jgi:hypothetical protein
MTRFGLSAKRKSTIKPASAAVPAAGAILAPAVSAPAVSGPVVTTVGHDAIAKLAYEIWLKNGRARGRDLQNWREAEVQLRSTVPAR